MQQGIEARTQVRMLCAWVVRTQKRKVCVGVCVCECVCKSGPRGEC